MLINSASTDEKGHLFVVLSPFRCRYAEGVDGLSCYDRCCHVLFYIMVLM